MPLFGWGKKPDEAEEHFKEAGRYLARGLKGFVDTVKGSPQVNLSRAVYHLEEAVRLKPDNKKYQQELARVSQMKEALEKWLRELLHSPLYQANGKIASSPRDRLHLYQSVVQALIDASRGARGENLYEYLGRTPDGGAVMSAILGSEVEEVTFSDPSAPNSYVSLSWEEEKRRRLRLHCVWPPEESWSEEEWADRMKERFEMMAEKGLIYPEPTEDPAERYEDYWKTWHNPNSQEIAELIEWVFREAFQRPESYTVTVSTGVSERARLASWVIGKDISP